MHLIVGLGNPGEQYARTRHNIGWLVLDELCRRHSIELGRKQHEAKTGSGQIGEARVLIAKPQTFMNGSGRAAAPLLRYHNISLPHVLVVTDDLNLPLGRLRLRAGGSDGGHNGLKSIAQSLGSKEYPRLRLGVGEPPREERIDKGTADFVLRAFAPDERASVEEAVSRAADCAETWVQAGLAEAMNRFNG